MALLISFINYLNDEERHRLAAMPLTGKERLIRDSIMVGIGSVNGKSDLMKELCLSSAHYDKTSTVVLKKAYQYLAGDGDLEQLNFLSRKFMFRHLFHEIKHQRNKIAQSDMPHKDLETYFRVFFDFSINVPAKYFDEAFVNENASQYLQYVITDKEARELEVKAKILFARLNLLTQAPPEDVARSKIQREMVKLEKRYAKVCAPEMHAILYHSWVNFHRVLLPDWQKRTYYLKKIKDLYQQKGRIPIFESAVADLHEAEIHFEKSEFQKSFDLYSQTFAHYLPILRNQFHHFARWIEVALILDKYDDARRLLDSLFKVYVDNHHESNGVLGSLLYAQLELLQGDFTAAFNHISLARSLNTIQVYFNYELKSRMLEILYFAFNNEHDFVQRLAQRNMRYLQLQKLSLKKYRYAHFFYLLKDFASIKRRYPNKLTPKVKAYMEEFCKGYDMLLWKMLDKLFRIPAHISS